VADGDGPPGERAGRGTNRREDVIRAAADLIGRNGYEGTSMRDIARAVGMLPGSLYYHFASKEDLFAALHDHAVARYHAALDAALEGLSDPWERLEAAVRAHLGELLGNRNLMAIVRPDAGGADPALAGRIVAERDRYDSRIAGLVAALDLPEGTDRRLFRLMLLGALNWTPVWYSEGRAMDPAGIAAAFVAMWRKGGR
jgi:AcrR family transcriptional regulator